MRNRTKEGTRDLARRRVVCGIGAFAASSLLASISHRAVTQTTAYPSRTVRILVGYSPGGTVDAMARLIADNLREPLRQNVIVENHPGASGNIAAQTVGRAQPDGHTLLFGNPAEMVINKFMMKDMGFDPDVDFAPVVLVFNVPNVLVVPANSPYKTLDELLDDARRNPGKVTYASAGNGTPGHLAGETLALRAKAPMVHVPYKGGNPALTDVIAGHVNFYFAGSQRRHPALESREDPHAGDGVPSARNHRAGRAHGRRSGRARLQFPDLGRAVRPCGNAARYRGATESGDKSNLFAPRCAGPDGERTIRDPAKLAGAIRRVRQGRIRKVSAGPEGDRRKIAVTGDTARGVLDHPAQWQVLVLNALVSARDLR